jgi:hypothetical protein
LNRVAGAIVYGKAEEGDNMSGENRLNTVLVEADKIEDLKAAYPNYFGDVQLFSTNLQHITRGEVAQEYTMPPRQTYPPLTKGPPDMSWFRQVVIAVGSHYYCRRRTIILKARSNAPPLSLVSIVRGSRVCVFP